MLGTAALAGLVQEGLPREERSRPGHGWGCSGGEGPSRGGQKLGLWDRVSTVWGKRMKGSVGQGGVGLLQCRKGARGHVVQPAHQPLRWGHGWRLHPSAAQTEILPASFPPLSPTGDDF